MHQWMICKNSRIPNHPYYGPTCIYANVPQGKVYDDIEEAEFHAAMLSAFNAVGFSVHPWSGKSYWPPKED